MVSYEWAQGMKSHKSPIWPNLKKLKTTKYEEEDSELNDWLVMLPWPKRAELLLEIIQTWSIGHLRCSHSRIPQCGRLDRFVSYIESYLILVWLSHVTARIGSQALIQDFDPFGTLFRGTAKENKVLAEWLVTVQRITKWLWNRLFTEVFNSIGTFLAIYSTRSQIPRHRVLGTSRRGLYTNNTD